jgi:tRNA (guanine37-N1)-methyltransferase
MQEKERRSQLTKLHPATGVESVDQSTDVKHPSPRQGISHFVMNLPDSAIEFLDCFQGIFSGGASERDLSGIYTDMPMIHCHCFTRELEPDKAEADIKQVTFCD